MTTTSAKPATSFWVVSAVALVWNAMGVMAYLMQMMMTPESLAALPEIERELYTSMPSWATSAFAFAVWGGLLGCILLLLRKKVATTVLMISFAGIVVQMIYNVFISNSYAVYGPGGMIMPVMVLVIGAYLIWFSRSAAEKGWMS